MLNKATQKHEDGGKRRRALLQLFSCYSYLYK